MWFARDTGERDSRHGDIYKIQNTVCFRFTFLVCYIFMDILFYIGLCLLLRSTAETCRLTNYFMVSVFGRPDPNTWESCES